MEPRDIQLLLEKYYNAQTTLEEEKILKKYFEAENNSNEKAIFKFYENEKQISFIKSKKNNSNEKKFKWKISAIAASLVIGMIFATFYMGENKTTENANMVNVKNPEQAYLETIKALKLVSTELNKGVAQTQYLNEYENTKKLIFKK